MTRQHSPTAHFVLGALLLASCASTAGPAPAVDPGPQGDPEQGEVLLPCAEGWEARLLLDLGGTGIWTVKAFPVFGAYAVPEVIGLDDLGRCQVLVSYSGKWTALPRVHDGRWLGGLTHGDVDPRIEGAELYTGGQRGNLYQLVAHDHGALDARLIAHIPGREIHTIVAGELDPSNDTPELFVFTRPGGLFRVSPTAEHGRFEATLLEDLPGRVRDALVLPAREGEHARLVTVGREGELRLLVITDAGRRWSVLHSEPMGMGRIAQRVTAESDGIVLYTTLDDGRVLRHEESAAGWETETIFIGAQGLRGIASGGFAADPRTECVAIFGYSGKLQLLCRPPGGRWQAETVFEDRDKGHWLSAAELDGRNGTRELLGCGYGGRIFQLSRPAGFGCSTPVLGSK